MKLTNRLQTIASMVKDVTRIADIGTDHGYLPVALVECHSIKKAIASDINPGPLKNAMDTIAQHGMQGVIETRLGGGLEPYQENEVEAYVIAGMGGLLIAHILERSDHLARQAAYLILQPMQKQADLRLWLCQNKYDIIEEKIAIEGNKTYEIIKVVKGKGCEISPLQADIGIAFKSDAPYLVFLENTLRRYEHIHQGLITGHRYDEATQMADQITQMKEVIKCVSTQVKSSK